jgi:putative transposase
MDVIHYKVKENGIYHNKTAYSVLALNLAGKRTYLGLYLSENEEAHFWLSFLVYLQNRGLNDILSACVDGWVGFSEAMNTIYPQTVVQLCVIHQICHSIKYVASKHHEAFMSDLKPVYKTMSRDVAIDALNELERIWGDKYLIVIPSWCRK